MYLIRVYLLRFMLDICCKSFTLEPSVLFSMDGEDLSVALFTNNNNNNAKKHQTKFYSV